MEAWTSSTVHCTALHVVYVGGCETLDATHWTLDVGYLGSIVIITRRTTLHIAHCTLQLDPCMTDMLASRVLRGRETLLMLVRPDVDVVVVMIIIACARWRGVWSDRQTAGG